MAPTSPVRELRLAVTVENYDEAFAFYRDALGLPVIEAWDNPTGSGAILDAGHATLGCCRLRRQRLSIRSRWGVRPLGRFALRLRWPTRREPPRCLKVRERQLSEAPS